MIHIVFNKFKRIWNDNPNVVKQNHLNQFIENREDTFVSEKRFMLRRHLSLCLLFACIWRDADGDLLMRGIRGGSGEYIANHWICQQGAYGKKLRQIILSNWLSLQAVYFALHGLSSDKHKCIDWQYNCCKQNCQKVLFYLVSIATPKFKAISLIL